MECDSSELTVAGLCRKYSLRTRNTCRQKMGKDSEKGKYASPEGSRTWEYLSTLSCAIGTFCSGTMIGWNSPSLAEFRDPNSRIPMTPEETSTLLAALAMGFVAAPLVNVFIVDRIGRRKSILASTVPLLTSWGLILVAEHVMVLTVARMMAGFSLGVASSTRSIYMSEILSTKIRGSLTVISYISFYLGVLFMFAVAPHLGVRLTAGVCMAMATVFAVCFWFVPESPYFLVMVGREDEAEAALEKLRGKTDVADELQLIRATLREKGKALVKSDGDEKGGSQGKQNALKQLFTIRGNLKALSLGLMLMTISNVSGAGTITNYCHVILEDVGSGLDVYVASMTFSILQVLSSSFTVFVIDKCGRRPLLLTSGIISGLLLAIIAIYFYLIEHTDMEVKRYGWIPLCSIFGLVMALNMGVTVVPDIVQAEMYATDVKLLSSSIVTVSDSIIGIFSIKYYLLISTTWGFGHSVPFFSYATLTMICMVIVARWLPETKGKTLLQIQKELNA